ncbi:hypothetical protein DDE18_02930 [Nocardioides gansuensis]|uniref:2-C-methyl-D-erythritol 4-phosphate cytidylyltransferase n=1 Tax=Nocardioides gansuensis TaxID=2138300 RepID=A0A2T8FFS5_9ACTN|nr:2-C-methyl-D-erythritol 4-phosphate cytidylyltransferase [Nocardioides gansuensis]PVG84572.1 hypothetical protein DDE18_02930 [Nocardioides gansuensis]
MMGDDAYDEPQPALGRVLDEGRGSLPYSLIHGEALVACAAWALGEAGATPIDVGASWSGVRTSGEPFVLHDSLCPMTPPAFIAACVRRAVEAEVVVVGVRPVTDTIRVVEDGFVGSDVDRDGLAAVCSPVVLPPSVLRSMAEPPGDDLVAFVAGLPDDVAVELVAAPPAARRVSSAEEVRLLEALTAEARAPGPRGR